MQDFIYHTPTKVYFGKDKHLQVGEIIRELGYDIIMLQYGKESIKKSGLYDQVMKSLSEQNITVVEMGGVEPNPKLSFVRKAVAVAKEKKVELILAVGGGSVLDSAKATAVGAACDTDVWEFSSRRETPKAGLPIGCILTLAAAGSEMSSSAVITNEEDHMKRGYNSEFNRCTFAICNPALTYSVGKYQTACGIVDIMAHTMERYFAVCEPTPLTDRIAEGILKSIIEAGAVLMEQPEDYQARATMMWASSLSHNDLTGCGRENALPVHQMEHGLSGVFDHIAHGAGLAVLFPAWMRFAYQKAPERFAQFARRVWDITEKDDEKAAILGIEAMEDFYRAIEMPLQLRDFGIDKADLEEIAEVTTFGKQRTVPSHIMMDYGTILEILKSCY